jgi:hypothetical protein
MPKRPRNIINDIFDCIESVTSEWTKQAIAEERRPSTVWSRASRMTREKSRHVTQKDAAWEVMEDAYMRASDDDRLPAKARQIFYQARPKIMALTKDRELKYEYFSQTLLPDYMDERRVDWDVVYDARGSAEEPHTRRSFGCGTLEVRSYLAKIKDPAIVAASFASAGVDIIGPSGNISALLYCEKEGFGPLFRASQLADRYDLMILSNKGVSVTAGRRLIDELCGRFGIPLFVLHDFDADGFKILGTLQRDTRRYQFVRNVEVIDLGLRLDDIEGLEREPASAKARQQGAEMAANGATPEEIDILLNQRVELNALTSSAFIGMCERKLKAYGLKKVIPDQEILAKAYRAFDRSQRLRAKFEEMQEQFEEDAEDIDVPMDLEERVRAVLAEHAELRWDAAIKIVLNAAELSRVREDKGKAERKAGDCSGSDAG